MRYSRIKQFNLLIHDELVCILGKNMFAFNFDGWLYEF